MDVTVHKNPTIVTNGGRYPGLLIHWTGSTPDGLFRTRVGQAGGVEFHYYIPIPQFATVKLPKVGYNLKSSSCGSATWLSSLNHLRGNHA
nr:uncharacterized protein CTRU02_02335 [Colletotrichum truncatum]KAF6798361.1 hypothetical protein CTRU02_02335 [Colletotrichum truncatum]